MDAGCTVSRDRVDRLDVLGAELEEQLHRRSDDLALLHPRAEHAVDLLVDPVDDPGRVVEQGELVHGLDLPCLEHHRLRVDEVEARALEGEQRRHVGDVDADRLAREPALGQLAVRPSLRARPARRSHPASPRASARPTPASSIPGATGSRACGGGRRAEVPEHRVVLAEHEGEADVLVALPRPDRRARDVAEIVGVEQEQGAEVGCRELRLRLLEARARSRAKSTRCSQSTAIVAPREAMFMIAPSGWSSTGLFSDLHTLRYRVNGPDGQKHLLDSPQATK